jgi:LysR family pca operon transcriptional activator
MPAKRYISQKLRLNLLRAADAIETQRSLLKASAFLGISQPALTKSLQELEDILQLRLFERHSRGVRPTEAGIVFIHSARRMLAELKRLDEELDHVSGPMGGTAALGALPVAAAGVLPGVLTRLRALYPAISIRLQQGRTEELLPLLASGEIDLIVGRLYQPVVPDGFVREPLWTEPISILARAGHELFKLDHVTVEDLGRYELVLPTREPACRSGDRTSACDAWPDAHVVAALEFVWLHAGNAARKRLAIGDAAAHDGRRHHARLAAGGAAPDSCARQAGRPYPSA